MEIFLFSRPMGGWAELKKPDWPDLKTENRGLTGGGWLDKGARR